MSFADERRAIESRFAVNFTALSIRYENQPFDMPASGGFVAFSIRSSGGRQVSTGPNPLFRYNGSIVAEIFVPENTGGHVARQHADSIEAIYRNVQFFAGDSGSIRCRAAGIGTSRLVDGWHRLTVTIPFQRDRFFG